MQPFDKQKRGESNPHDNHVVTFKNDVIIKHSTHLVIYFDDITTYMHLNLNLNDVHDSLHCKNEIVKITILLVSIYSCTE